MWIDTETGTNVDYKFHREFVLLNHGEAFLQEVVVYDDGAFSADSTYAPTFQSKNRVRITNMLDCSLFALTINY